MEAILPTGQIYILRHVATSLQLAHVVLDADDAAPFCQGLFSNHGVARQHAANKANPDPNVWWAW